MALPAHGTDLSQAIAAQRMQSMRAAFMLVVLTVMLVVQLSCWWFMVAVMLSCMLSKWGAWDLPRSACATPERSDAANRQKRIPRLAPMRTVNQQRILLSFTPGNIM